MRRLHRRELAGMPPFLLFVVIFLGLVLLLALPWLATMPW